VGFNVSFASIVTGGQDVGIYLDMQGEQSIKGEIWISKKRGMGIF
jgi:hypothetical protein